MESFPSIAYRPSKSGKSAKSWTLRAWIEASRVDQAAYAHFVHGIDYDPHQSLMRALFWQTIQDKLVDPQTALIVRNTVITGPPDHGKTSVCSTHGIPVYLGGSPWLKALHWTSS